MFRQDRHQSHDQRHLAVAIAIECELHLAFARLFGAGDFLVIGAVVGTAMIAQRLEGEDHVIDRDRRAVGELGLRVQRELDGAPVLRHVDRLGDQPIEREGLVIGARHQALIDEVADALGGDAFDDEGIETVEGPAPGEDQPAALWRVRIDVGKGGETLLGPRLAMHGDSRRGLRNGPSGRWQEGRNAKQKQRKQGFQGRARMAIDASALRHAQG